MTNDECRMTNGGGRFAPSLLNIKIVRIPSFDILHFSFFIQTFGTSSIDYMLASYTAFHTNIPAGISGCRKKRSKSRSFF